MNREGFGVVGCKDTIAKGERGGGGRCCLGDCGLGVKGLGVLGFRVLGVQAFQA